MFPPGACRGSVGARVCKRPGGAPTARSPCGFLCGGTEFSYFIDHVIDGRYGIETVIAGDTDHLCAKPDFFVGIVIGAAAGGHDSLHPCDAISRLASTVHMPVVGSDAQMQPPLANRTLDNIISRFTFVSFTPRRDCQHDGHHPVHSSLQPFFVAHDHTSEYSVTFGHCVLMI